MCACAAVSARLAHVPSTIKANAESTEKESFEIQLILDLMLSYFALVKKNVADLVPKSTMAFLVNEAKAQIQNELVRELYREEMFDMLLEESPQVATRRRQCHELIKVLREAARVIAEVRDFTV